MDKKFVCSIPLDDKHLLGIACRSLGLDLTHPPTGSFRVVSKGDNTFPPIPQGAEIYCGFQIVGTDGVIGIGKIGDNLIIIWEGQEICSDAGHAKKLVSKIRQAYSFEKIVQIAIKKGYRISGMRRTEKSNQVSLYMGTTEGKWKLSST